MITVCELGTNLFINETSFKYISVFASGTLIQKYVQIEKLFLIQNVKKIGFENH